MFANYSKEIFSFESPHDLDITRNVLVETITVNTAKYDTQGKPHYIPCLATPPIIAGIFFSEVTSNRIVVTAGNNIETYWQVIADLRSVRGGTKGDVYLDRRRKDIRYWEGDVLQFTFMVTDLGRSSFVITKQKL